MLEKEYEFFQDHRDEFVKEHQGEFVAIQDNKVLGFYKSKTDALTDLSDKYKLGTILIQECVSEDKETQIFHSRVVM